ncbi:MAG: hypothetical protein HQ523_13720 [Lentisphaerae bacterium]|nr:hypothetical protein [Lentisphaerota bacterium]
MSFLFRRWLSIDSRGARAQFGVGMLLFFAVPVLAMWYFVRSGWDQGGVGPVWVILFCSAVLMLALAGFLLMRRGAMQVEALRRLLEGVVQEGVTAGVDRKALAVASDAESINACMRVIMGELRRHIEDVEGERDRLQTELGQAQKVEGLGTMATGVAHDFNNLIAAVMGNASIVLNSMAADSPARDNALQIQATAAQAVELTGKIGLYSGHCRFDGAPVKLSSLVSEQAEVLEAIVFRGVKMEYRLDEDMPLICGDRQQLQELLRALVSNASDGITNRVGTITVSTGVMLCDESTLSKTVLQERLPPGRYAFIEVADDGCGIPQEVRQRMFDPFYSHKIRGRGLGLSVVLGVTRAHSGGVLVESVPDHGSVFRAIFPCPSALNDS